MTGLLDGFAGMLKRDLLLAWRQRGDIINPLLFFVLMVCLFPLGSKPSADALAEFAPAIIWMAALLSTLMGLERLFRSDMDDGSLEQLLLSPQPAALLTLAKILAHWLTSALPLILISPVLAAMLSMPGKAVPILMLSLLLGTPILSLIGAVGVALTAGLQRGGMLLALLVLPLYAPVLIFGAGAVSAAMVGLPAEGGLWFLAAILALAITLAPFGAAMALRVTVE